MESCDGIMTEISPCPTGIMENRVKFTGILRESYEQPTSSTKLPSSVMYSCASAQSAAPIHGAADEFKAELEVSRSR